MTISHSETPFIDVYSDIMGHLCSLFEDQWSLLNEESSQAIVDDSKRMLLNSYQATLSVCRRCKLNETRTHVVYGEGYPNADIMFIGEGPGQTEDETGRPFVGKAGQLLDKIIAAMGYSRESVYIANIVKCRPPHNRNPQTDETSACLVFLDQQIAIVRPKILVTLGSPAVKTLLNTSDGASRLRGQFHNYKGIPLLPTYHPAFLLREPDHKKETWEDMQKVMKFLKPTD